MQYLGCKVRTATPSSIGRATLLAAAVALLLTALAYAAGDHFIGDDSVDSTAGNEIAYEDYTRYNAALTHAVNVWNQGGAVVITPDDAGSVTDLEWYDYTDSSQDAKLGFWQPVWYGPDKISLNTHFLGAADGGTREKHVAAHEQGHALGIADHQWSSTEYAHILMYGVENWTTAPQTHDRRDYGTLWGGPWAP